MSDPGAADDAADDDAAAERALPIVPLFPLPEFFLFPDTVLPLRIFEPRYVQMVEDLLDTSGRLVLAAVVPGHEGELMGRPPVHPVAGLGEIMKHERLPNGHFIIFVRGLRRVRLREVASDRLYRKVEVGPFFETAAEEADDAALRPKLEAAVRSFSQDVPLAPRLPLKQLIDLLLLHLRLDPATKIDLFSRRDVAERGRDALALHGRLPLPPTKPGGPTKDDAATN